MINDFKQAIKTKLLTLDIGEVNLYEKVGFSSVPAVNVTMSGSDSEFWSVANNQRGYNFILRVFIPFNSNTEVDKEVSESTIGDVVDSILDAFDSDITLGDLALFLRAAPSSWGYVDIEEGLFRSADIRLQVVKQFNTRG